LTRSKTAWLGVAVVAIGAFGAIIAVATSAWTAISVVLAAATIVVAAVPLVRRFRDGTFDLLEPIVGGSVVLAVIFGVRPLAMLPGGDFVYRDVDIRPEFPFVIALGLIGTMAFTLGYDWVRGRQAPSATVVDRADHRLLPAIIYGYIAILAILSVVLFGVHLVRLGDGLVDGLRLFAGGTSPELVTRWAGTTEYLSASPILAACAATLLGVATRWRLNRYQLALTAALILYPLVIFYVSGDRRYMIPTLGVPVVAWMLMSGRRLSRRVLILAVPIAFVVLTAIPFVRWGAAQEGSGGIAAAFVQGIGNPVRAVERFILGPDTSMFDALAIEVRILREPGDFFYGRATVGDLILAPMPHLLIQDKPQTARDELLVRAYGSPCTVTVLGVCDDFSVIGTFYQDFWIPGVVVLMAAVGAASAALWFGWRRSSGDPRLIVALSAWIVFIPIMFRAGFMPAMAWCLYFVAPSLIGVLISLRRTRQAMSSPAPGRTVS
jgi:hypothetical protein